MITTFNDKAGAKVAASKSGVDLNKLAPKKWTPKGKEEPILFALRISRKVRDSGEAVEAYASLHGVDFIRRACDNQVNLDLGAQGRELIADPEKSGTGKVEESF